MVCKFCGNNIEKDWDYCPNCATKINKGKTIKNWQVLLIILKIVIDVILIMCFTSVLMKNVTTKYIEKSLENKYNENFDNIQFVSEIDNPDIYNTPGGCPSYTTKGKGSTNYYKLYSEKTDMEFYAFYDKTKGKSEITDTYEIFLKRRNAYEKSYSKVNTYLANSITSVSIVSEVSMSERKYDLKEEQYNLDDEIKFEHITSITELKRNLSKLDNQNMIQYSNIDVSLYGEKLYVYVNEKDLLNFCKKNYDSLNKLNDEMVKLYNEAKNMDDFYVDVEIVFGENENIKINKYNSKMIIKHNNYDLSEDLDDFIKREEY